MVEKGRGTPIDKRTLYIPRMCEGSTRLFAAAFRSNGIDARACPPGDARTRELAARHLTGDECYPQMVTLGSFLKITEEHDFDPSLTALFMPTATGPCRFGQYTEITRRTMEKVGAGEVMLVSPTCDDGYAALGQKGGKMMHYGFWALVAGDLLRKMLHRFRPYETVAGAADNAYGDSLADAENALSDPEVHGRAKYKALVDSLKRARKRFLSIPADFGREKILVGVLGEIFCRLSTFSNEDVVRRIEAHGGEVWVAGIAEWVYYVNYWELEEMRYFGRTRLGRMAKAWASDKVQHMDEHGLTAVFARELAGREEPHSISEILEYTRPFIEPRAALGEMVLNIGNTVYYKKMGADAVVDLSPFSCMNAIVSEAVYPKLSRSLDGLPIKVFYFDGTSSNLDEEVELFMELAGHKKRKRAKKPA